MATKTVYGSWIWELDLECPYCQETIIEHPKLSEGETFSGKIKCPECAKTFMAKIEVV